MTKSRIEESRPALLALDGGPDFALGRGLLVLGRDPLCCDLRVDSPRVSRVHCCLARCRDEVIVRDLGSTNGTAVNGRRTWAGRLRVGDELSVAGLRYRLEAVPGASTRSRASPDREKISPRLTSPGPD